MLRNWHSREARIIRTMKELVANAEKAADAFRNGEHDVRLISLQRPCACVVGVCAGDLVIIGDCLTKYRKQKVVMAPGNQQTLSQLPRTVSLSLSLSPSGSLPQSVKFFIEKTQDHILGKASTWSIRR